MDPDKVFIVDFTGNEVKILHSKCGCEILKITVGGKSDQGSFWFLCPKCRFETMHFSQNAWDQVLERLESSPAQVKMSVETYCVSGGITLFSELVMVLKKRILPE
ncbi:hypothetical protein KKG58_00130 [Patescibacteria group bacterium]|nr:hypothetical protein [Patescibacteria group bacterium]